VAYQENQKFGEDARQMAGNLLYEKSVPEQTVEDD
jgi:hypothetical protein